MLHSLTTNFSWHRELEHSVRFRKTNETAGQTIQRHQHRLLLGKRRQVRPVTEIYHSWSNQSLLGPLVPHDGRVHCILEHNQEAAAMNFGMCMLVAIWIWPAGSNPIQALCPPLHFQGPTSLESLHSYACCCSAHELGEFQSISLCNTTSRKASQCLVQCLDTKDHAVIKIDFSSFPSD